MPQHGRNVELEASNEAPEGVLVRSRRMKHAMYSVFMDRIRSATATAFSLKVWAVIQHLEDRMTAANTSFELESWEEDAHAMAISRPWNTQILKLPETWYTGPCLLVRTWEEEEPLVMQRLKMRGAFNGLDCPEAEQIKMTAENPDSFYKLGRLHYHLIQKPELKGEDFKCVVFVQQ